jgi:hypothetical protein
VGKERDMDRDRPVDPEEARAQGNDPDAVRMDEGDSGTGTRPGESAPRKVGDIHE